MKTFTELQIHEILQRRCLGGKQKHTAEELGFSHSFINDVLCFKRPITSKLALALGFEKAETLYTRKPLAHARKER